MQRIDVGLSMLYCLSNPFSYMTDQLGKVRASHVELVDESYHTLNIRRTKVLKEISQVRNLGLTVHAPFVDVNIASPNTSFRRLILKRHKRSIELASRLGATLWVFHSGLQTGVSHFHPGEDWRLNLQSIRELLEAADGNEIKIAIENTPNPFPFILKNVNDFGRFYGELGDAGLGLTLDIAHANVNGQIDDFMKEFSDKIIHIHASDNDGTFDSHLRIGEGNIDWGKIAESLRSMNYAGVVIVESEKDVPFDLSSLGEPPVSFSPTF